MNDHVSRNITPSQYRLVIVRAKNVCQLIGSQQHQLKDQALMHFCDGIVGSLLLASQLKGQGVLSLEFDSDGAFKSFRSDATPLGLVRAMIPEEHYDNLISADQSLPLIGKGNLFVGKKLNDAKQPFSSIVELVGSSMTENLSAYLRKSEQINGAIFISSVIHHQQVISADGFLIEEMPGVKQTDRDQMNANLSKIKDPLSLFANEPSDQEIIQRIIGDIPYQHMKDFEVQFFCPCTEERFLDKLVGLPRTQIEQLQNEGDQISLECDFCKKEYEFSLTKILNIKDSQN